MDILNPQSLREAAQRALNRGRDPKKLVYVYAGIGFALSLLVRLGTLFLDDPNNFGGPLMIQLAGGKEPMEIPLSHAYTENSRALGLADMAKALLTGREARCDVQQTYHVLEIIAGFETSAKTGQWTEIESRYHRAPAMVLPILKGILD